MGQKSQPISLRLEKTNRSFDSCWSSDFYYKESLKRQIESQFFIDSILKQIKASSARFFIENFPKKSKITFFFLDPARSRSFRARNFGLPLPGSREKPSASKKSMEKGSLSINSPFVMDRPREKILSINDNLSGSLVLWASIKKISSYQNSQSDKRFILMDQVLVQQFIINKPGSDKTTTGIQKTRNHLPALYKNCYRNRIQDLLSTQFHSQFGLYPIRSISSFQSALFLAEEIVYYLEKRVPFRKIKNSLFRELRYHPEIKGIRLSCSGRVGRIQRAKKDYVKSGQTPLNLFSSKIDFASVYGITPFGLVGIKVWICFA